MIINANKYWAKLNLNEEPFKFNFFTQNSNLKTAAQTKVNRQSGNSHSKHQKFVSVPNHTIFLSLFLYYNLFFGSNKKLKYRLEAVAIVVVATIFDEFI